MGLGFDGSAMVKAGLTGKNPTDRAKLGLNGIFLQMEMEFLWQLR